MNGERRELAPAGGVAVAEVLNRVIDSGAVVSGDVLITLGGIDLVHLDLRLLLTSIEAAQRRMADV